MKKLLIVLTTAVFGLLVLLNSNVFYYITREPALRIANTISFATAALLSFIIASIYKNRLKAHLGNRKTVKDYFMNICMIIAAMYFFSFALSLAGGVISYLAVTILNINSNVDFVNGAFFTVPMFALYLYGIYKIFSEMGYTDCVNNSFNLHFKITAIILAFIVVLPSTVVDNMYSTITYHLKTNPFDAFINVRSLFSANIDLSLSADNGLIKTLGNSGMVSVMLKSLLIFALEMAVAVSAYIRGKVKFAKRYLVKYKDYPTDEATLPARPLKSVKYYGNYETTGGKYHVKD